MFRIDVCTRDNDLLSSAKDEKSMKYDNPFNTNDKSHGLSIPPPSATECGLIKELRGYVCGLLETSSGPKPTLYSPPEPAARDNLNTDCNGLSIPSLLLRTTNSCVPLAIFFVPELRYNIN